MRPLVGPATSLDRARSGRWQRQMGLPGVGSEGQRRLAAARVLVVGAGGLGAPVLSYLVAAGVGAITVVDDDVVEASNLHRQVLYGAADVGRPKVEVAAEVLSRMDPGATVTGLCRRLDRDNATELFAAHDLVVDGADNFATRYLVSDAAELTGTPVVWGSILRFAGQVSVFWPGQGPMLRDLFPEEPSPDAVPSCAEAGVFGALCGTVGSLMASEAVKLLCGLGEPLVGRLLLVDMLAGTTRTLSVVPDPGRPGVTALPEPVLDGCAASSRDVELVTVAELCDRREHLLLVDVREEHEREAAAIPGSVWVPMGELLDQGWPRLALELAGAPWPGEVVIHCASGRRSARCVMALAADAPAGVRLASLDGGIEAWSRRAAAGEPPG